MSKIIIFILFAFALPLSIVAHGGVNDDELIIRMTKNGFEPRTLTVTEGDSVLFINNDDVDRWPASNFHPTHTLYPEFDPQKGIPAGSSWKTTFNKVGTWKMHDHLLPHMTGTIIVQPDPDKTATTTDSNQAEESFWTRLYNFFLKLFSNGEKSTDIPLDEHGRAHLNGQNLFKKYGIDGLSKCTPEFAFGCYHGFTEAIFTGNTEEEYVKNILGVEGSCLDLGKLGSGPNASCIHGIGHGVATFRDHDMKKSMKDCDLLDNQVRTYCHDGVFMEFSISAPANFYRQNDPIYPCNTLDDMYKSGCTRSQVKVMSQRFAMPTNVIFNTCKQTANSIIIYNCADSLGLYMAQDNKNDTLKIVAGCREIENETYAAQCMAAAAGELVFQNYAGWRESVLDICSELSTEDQEKCQMRVDEVKKSYNRN